MTTYKFTVQDDFFPQVFNAEQEANTPEEAEQLVREWYAEDLGTYEGSLIVTLVEEVVEGDKVNDAKVFEDENGQFSLFSPKYEVECVVEYDIFDFMDGETV